MEGPTNAEEHTQGMIPRALQQIFTTAQELSDKGWTVGLQVHKHTCILYHVQSFVN